MKRLYIILSIFLIMEPAIAQNDELKNDIFRINIINPGIEYEYSVSNKSKISANIGYGILPSYPNTTAVQPKKTPLFAPFLDMQYKFIYNQNKRKAKNKSITYNSGDFWGIKFIGRGKNYDNGLVRTNNIDFAIGPTWGMQRTIKKISLLFNVGPQFYFDGKGNNGFYPMFEFNIGYTITNK